MLSGGGIASHPTRDSPNSLSMAPTSTMQLILKEHTSLLLYLNYSLNIWKSFHFSYIFVENSLCPSINQCFSASLSGLVEDKMLVCLSVSVSCLLLSSSSHCVVSTLEKRGTKKKSSTSVPKSLPIIVPTTFPSAPCVRPGLSL